MKVSVSLEQRYERTPDGSTWTSGQFPYDFWTRYLDVFAAVRVLARVKEVAVPPPGSQRADGPQVSVAALPYYLGPWQYLRQRGQLGRAIRAALTLDQAYLLRVSSPIGSLLQPLLYRQRYPYGVQVVCDPYDIFAPGVIKHPLAPFLRRRFSQQMRRQCAEAQVAAYVTNDYLQRRYPCPARELAVSDVHLEDAAFAAGPRHWPEGGPSFKLLFVGSLAQLYKAPDLVLKAVKAAVAAGLDLRLVMIGDGRCRPQMEALAAAEGLAERVEWVGQVAGAPAVRQYLDQADLLLLPSRTEGLPRAIIEAMARGLPCVASTAGGIPELLAAEDLVPPGDSAALSTKIREVLTEPKRLERMSARNLEAARAYHLDLIRAREREFLKYLETVTSASLTAAT